MGARSAGCLADSRSVCRLEVSSEYALLHDAGMLRAMKSLWEVCRESHKRKKMLVALTLCQCEWEGWVSGQRPGWLQQPIGPRGLTLCTWCKRGFPLWLSQLWSNWKLQQNQLVA